MDAPPDDRVAAALRGAGPVGVLAVAVVLAGNLLFIPLSALLVAAWAHATRTPARALGLVLPRRWLVHALVGVVGGVALKLLMKAVVMPLLGTPPVNPYFGFLAGNRAAIPGMLYSILVGAAVGEEVVFRGFLFERLGRWLGSSRSALVATIVLSSVVFGAAHLLEQGVYGAAQGLVVGLVFAGVYAATGSLWIPMWAHAAFDLVAYALIYFGLEGFVARFVFG